MTKNTTNNVTNTNIEINKTFIAKAGDNIKTIITIGSLIIALFSGLIAMYSWYDNVSDIVKDYPNLKAKITNMEDKFNGRDTLTPFVTKQKFYHFQEKEAENFYSIYTYKYPYNSWGTGH